MSRQVLSISIWKKFFVADCGFGDLGLNLLIPRNGKVEGILRRIHEFSALFRDRFISHTKQFKEYRADYDGIHE